MSKASIIAREKRRIRKSAFAGTTRVDLKKVIKDPNVDYEEKMLAVKRLNQKPRNQSKIRVRRRCECCGRPRSVYRLFGLCRLCLRKFAMKGLVPGLVKSSW